MYSTRSNASARKPFDFLQPPMVPRFGSPEDNSMGFGTLPSPKPIPAGISDQVFGLPMGTNGNYEDRQYATPEELRPSPVFLDMNMSRNPDGTGDVMGFAFNQAPDGSLSPTNGINKYGRFQTRDPKSFANGEKFKQMRDLYQEKLLAGRTPAYQPFGQDYVKEQYQDVSPERQAELSDLKDLQRMRTGSKLLLNVDDFMDVMGLPKTEWNWLAEMKGPSQFMRADKEYFEKGNFAGEHGPNGGYPMPHGKELVKRGDKFVMQDHPVRDDLFDSPDSIPMLKENPMSVMTDRGELPVQPAQGAQQYVNKIPLSDGSTLTQRIRPITPTVEQVDPYAANYPPGADPMTDFAVSQRTAQMQGVPMGADPGSIQPMQQYQPQQFQQPQYQPMMQGGPMPYQGGMSGPHFQGQMQSMLGDLLSRQNMGRQYNDVTFARDAHDDAWDRLRLDIFNPLMGALGGGKTMEAMAADSNSRRAMIQNRRQFRRQAMDDQWGQTKDLVGMIAANDPQTLKNQNALAKLQMEMYQKAINQQNANTQQFGAQSNAAYKSRVAAVQEQNARTNESNMLRMLNEGAERTQQGWARLNQQAGQWQQSLAMRQAELAKRKSDAGQRGDQFAMQLAFREEQELNEEAYRYKKLEDEMLYKAESIDKEGNSKVSPEFLKKYGLQRSEQSKQVPQGFDLLKWMGFSQPAINTSQTKVSPTTPPSSASVARSPQFTREQALAELARRRKARAGK